MGWPYREVSIVAKAINLASFIWASPFEKRRCTKLLSEHRDGCEPLAAAFHGGCRMRCVCVHWGLLLGRLSLIAWPCRIPSACSVKETSISSVLSRPISFVIRELLELNYTWISLGLKLYATLQFFLPQSTSSEQLVHGLNLLYSPVVAAAWSSARLLMALSEAR